MLLVGMKNSFQASSCQVVKKIRLYLIVNITFIHILDFLAGNLGIS